MIWSDPSMLGIGAALTVLVLMGLWSHARRRRALAAFLGGRRALARLARPDLSRIGVGRSLLLGLAGVALAVALAEPRAVEAPVPEPLVKRVVLALDVSASMQAEDASPTRLGRAVAVAHELLDSLQDQEVGLLLYAGKAYPLAPPTLDHDVLRFLLSGLTPRIASAQDPGTLVSVAIRESVDLLDGRASSTDGSSDDGSATGRSDEDVSPQPSAAPPRPHQTEGERVVVLISDGDAGDLPDSITAAVDAARAADVRVHAIGVGTEAGAGMLMPDGTYQLGGPVVDASGRPGLSRMRESVLRDVASEGDGLYALADATADVNALEADLADPGPAPDPDPDSNATIWGRYDVPFLLGAFALTLVLLESLLGLTLPRLRIVRAREAA